MTEIEYVKYEAPNTKKKDSKPLTMLWNNERFIRVHSIRETAREIISKSNILDLVKINIIGPQSTGKTELSHTMAHLIHTMSKTPYVVKMFNKDNLENFEETIRTLQPQNHILIFEDVSFIKATIGAKKMSKVEQALTVIRHLPGGQDVKIIIFMNYHYGLAISPFLRNANFFYWTEVGTSDEDNTIKVLGRKWSHMIEKFDSKYQAATTDPKEYSFNLGKNKTFTYVYRKPFAPVLYYNRRTARIVVFPARKWVDNYCSLCDYGEPATVKKIMNVKDFDDDVSPRFGKGIVKQGLQIKLFSMGIDTLKPRVKQFMRYLDEYMKSRNCDPQQMAEYYNLTDKKTMLREDISHLKETKLS